MNKIEYRFTHTKKCIDIVGRAIQSMRTVEDNKYMDTQSKIEWKNYNVNLG